MTAVAVPAKINLALVVGERRDDGLHDVATVLQRIDLCDRLELEESSALAIDGFTADTLVRTALARLATEAGIEPRWRVRIEKRIPVAAGLGGGSADAGAALALANRTLTEPVSRERLLTVAASIGADVPFFLEPGPKLAEGAGEQLTPIELPQDFCAVIALRRGVRKRATGDVYRRFDEVGGGRAFGERRAKLIEALASCRAARDLAALPPSDLGMGTDDAPLVAELRAAGAFRADVTGAGPAVYGLFEGRDQAEVARHRLAAGSDVWVAEPVW